MFPPAASCYMDFFLKWAKILLFITWKIIFFAFWHNVAECVALRIDFTRIIFEVYGHRLCQSEIKKLEVQLTFAKTEFFTLLEKDPIKWVSFQKIRNALNIFGFLSGVICT